MPLNIWFHKKKKKIYIYIYIYILIKYFLTKFDKLLNKIKKYYFYYFIFIKNKKLFYFNPIYRNFVKFIKNSFSFDKKR